MNFKKIFKLGQKHHLLLIIICLALLSRIFFIGSSLWHNDAADFVYSGVKWAGTGVYEPAHAPDYPGWVALLAGAEKIYHALTGNFSPVVLPNLLTALLGVLAAVALYFLATNLFSSQSVGFIAALILIFQPVYWLYGEIALSEQPASLLIILALLFFERYSRLGSQKFLALTGLFLTLSILARLTNVFFLPFFAAIFVVHCWRAGQKPSLRQALVALFWLVAAPLALNAFVYGLTHQWSFDFLFSVSRRVTPTISELAKTLGKLWLEAVPLIFIFYLAGLVRLAREKKIYLFVVLFLPLAILFYYYAGWWRNGYFDLQRYFVATTPFVALGAGYGYYWLFKQNRQRALKVAVSLLLGASAVLMIVNLFYPASCARQALLAKIYLFPPSFCAINEIHFKADDRLKSFAVIDQELPARAAVVVGAYDWAFPRFFGNAYGLGDKEYYLMAKNDQDNLLLFANILTKHQVLYLPLYTPGLLNQNLIELLERQNWRFEYLTLTGQLKVIKILTE